MSDGEDKIYRNLRFDRDGVDFSQWPKLSCSAANELSLATQDDPNPGFARLAIAGELKLQIGVAVNELSSDGKLTNNSDLAIPTQKAVKTYVDAQISQVNQSLSVKAALAGASSQDFQSKNLSVSGNLTTAGNVGIGTTAPRAKLDVSGDLYVEGNIQLKGDNLAAMLLRKRHYHGVVDLDQNMPLVLHLCFESQLHIPKTIKLFLRGFRFSRAFYTELGRHTHQADAQPVNLQHGHNYGLNLTESGGHSHAIHVGNTGGEGKPGDHSYGGGYPSSLGGWRKGWVSLVTCVTGDTADYWVSSVGNHTHSVYGSIFPNLGEHKHTIIVSPTGGGVQAGEQVKEYLSDLQVFINRQKQTDSLLKRLKGWNAIGDGTAGHPMVTSGTGVLDITDLVPLTIGIHEVCFQVANGGGKLLYNVFCE